VGIIGAGPAGLVLAQILARSGIDAVVLERRDRAHIESRQRAGMLEEGVAQVLRDLGVGARMDALGFAHDGIYLQFDGARHHLDFRALTGRGLQLWAQTEIVKDLVAARVATGLGLEFEVSGVRLRDLDTDRPRITYTDSSGRARELVCDVVAGCDGFYGPSRGAVPAGALTVAERDYPYAWLGILAEVAPSTDQVIYASHPDGFALHSMRSATVSRMYLQVAPDENLRNWPDERVWQALQTRFRLPGWTLREGPIREKGITPMRSFVAGPMRHGRLFLAGDAVHIVPPTGAKGLNLAVADVVVLARALVAWLRDGDGGERAAGYDAACARRVRRTLRFATWMTWLTHTPPAPAGSGPQRAVLGRLTSSRAAARSMAEMYTGMPLLALPTASPAGPAPALVTFR
jgi:p-hydroxybenzoate 3-monooxygenase